MSLLPTGQSLIRSGRKVTESRLHDCLYDCEYTVSSTRDFERDVWRIRNAVNSIACYPGIYNETLPNECVTNSRSKRNDLEMTLIKGPPIRGVQIMAFPRPDTFDSRTKRQLPMSTAEFICKYRFKYFASPVTKNTSDTTNFGGITPKIIADVDTAAPVSKVNFKSEIIPPTPPIQTRETQTDYRDSEAQTDPYSPSYFIVPGSDTAELMALKNITWGNGLPAGRLEVDMILEARKRRLLKNKKPIVKRTDAIERIGGENMHHWEHLLQSSNVEADDWLYQSKILDENRSKRLLMLANSLNDLRDKHGDLIDERLRILWKRRNRSKEEANEKLRAEQNRELRKLHHKKNIPFETGELSGKASSSKTKSNDMLRFPRQSCPADNRLTKHTGGLEKSVLNRGATSRRSGMKYKFERDLEEAYVNIMEKKQMMSDIVLTQTNRSKGLALKQPKQGKTTENATWQTDAAEKLPAIVVGAQQDDDTELDAVLTKLLSDHWEFINKHFEELLSTLPPAPVDQSNSQAV